MANAGINSNINTGTLSARRALQQARDQIETAVPQFANELSRTFAITENGIDVAGSAERFVSGIASGNVVPAILDAGLNPIKAGVIAGGIAGALNSGSIQGALEGAVGGALNNALASSGIGDALNDAAAQLGVVLPEVPGLPGLGGSISGASGGAAASARASITRAGTTPGNNTVAARTSIVDATETTVEITIDSFLQSLQGSLSSIIGEAGKIGGLISGLLSSTGLTGALSGIVDGISKGLSSALGGLTNALGDAATGLMQGLGDTIKSIPGVGPALSGVTNAIGDFAGNLSGAYEKLAPGLKAGVDGAVAAVGANIVNKLDIPGVPRINPTIAGAITASVSFSNNPVAQLNDIATAARNLDKKIFKNTKDSTFANVSSAASKAAQQMQKNIQRSEDGNYQIIKDPNDASANIQKTSVVVNGELKPVTNRFEDNLNSVQLQSFNTYENILRSKFISYNNNAPNLAVQAYREYIEFDRLKTPETRSFINVIEKADADLIKNLADRFLLFFRSSKSRYTLTNL